MFEIKPMDTICRPARRAGKGFLTAAILALPLLGGCTGAEPGLVLLGGAAATVIAQDKLPTDYIADAATGLDCNAVRQSRDGGPWCRSQQYGTVIEAPIYCYRTLADITCYERPDPYRDGKEPIR